MKTEASNGMYLIDDNYKIVYYNDDFNKMYPEVETGMCCYEALGLRSTPCVHCPRRMQEQRSNFYNPNRQEWIHAQCSPAELPGFGKCDVITFTRTFDAPLDGREDLAHQNRILQEQNRFVEFINDGMPGGYHRCAFEEGFPFVYLSNRFLHILNIDRDTMGDRFHNNFLELVHPEDRVICYGAAGKANLGNLEEDTNLSFRLITGSGAYIRVMDTIRISEYDGERFVQGVIIDISEEESMREHIESLEGMHHALQEALSREQLIRRQLHHMQTEILDSISCGVFAYTKSDHGLLVVNDAAKAMIGCHAGDDPMQELRTFLLERIVPEDRQRVSDAGNVLKKPGDMLLQDYKALVDGEIICIHSNIKYLENAMGEPYILVTMLDTTEQSKLTNTLARERKAYRDALANGCEFSFFFDVTEGLIREEFVTAHGINLIKELGYTVPVSFDTLMADYIAYHQIEFLSEEMQVHFTCAGLKETYAAGITNAVSEYYSPVTGHSLRVSTLLSVDDETGHLHASVVGDDITEIRRNEKAQRESLRAANEEMNVRLNTILEGVSGGFKIANVDNGYRYEYISEGAAALQGYTVEEFLKRFRHRVTSNILPEEGEPALAEAMRQVMEKGSYAVKYRVPHKDGSLRYVIDRGEMVEDPVTGSRYLYILMQDITDLEDRNTQIQNVLTMQQQMADSLGNGIFAYSLPDYRVLILNQEAKRMFGLMGVEEKEFGPGIMGRICPEDLPVVREAIRGLIRPGDHVEYIFHAEHDLYGRLTVKSTTKLLDFGGGNNHYIISAITDITEQELTEMRLDEERRQYRNALAYNSNSIFTIDMTDGILRESVISKEGVDMLAPLGLTAPVDYDTLAAAWFDNDRIVTDSPYLEYIRSRQGLIDCCLSGTSLIDIEYHIPHDGRYFYVLILLYKINGHIHASFILNDVTADRHEERQRRSVIDSLGKVYLALYLFNFSEETCIMMKCSDEIAAELKTPCTMEEFYDYYFDACVEPEYLEQMQKFLDPDEIRKALRDTDYVSTEFRRKRLGWCRVTLVAAERDHLGNATSVVFAGNIIEKQKQAALAQQKALRTAYESANIANSAKTEFLANMSHDIRTPMNAIIGMTAIAGTHLDDRERVADCLSKISVSSKHLLGLINEVLDMSKIESGKMELQETAFNLPELIDNLLTMSKPTVAAKGHELTINIRSIEHEDVIGDSQRIQQVFMNLMSNAIKYTPAGGKIGLTISEKPTNKQCIGCYEFVFADNGIGMSEEFIEHIFEPFSRATNDSRIEKIQGTGLGMPITNNIIQMMNGTIDIKSRLNEGTTITVTIFLKLHDREEKIAYEKFIDLPVLVADDDEMSCLYACELLSELGMKGEWVLTGEEAVERTLARSSTENAYFAVILDWKMPGMDGVEATRQIREKIGNDVPIIIISAYDWTDIELEARAAGATDFISKPLFKSRMVHLFSSLIDGGGSEKHGTDLEALQEEDFTGRRALLVEDNALNAEIAGEILDMAGLEVEFAVNGKEAFERMSAVEDGYYDVVFMDIQMPVMNGYEAARAIRELPRSYTKSVPIIAMTANAFAEDVAAAKSAGMNEHIAKPLDFAQLLDALRRWLR